MRVFVALALRRKAHEMHVLAPHGADRGHLHHHPLQRVVTRRAILREELAGLVSQVLQDRA
jgi:hypothetical protein